MSHRKNEKIQEIETSLQWMELIAISLKASVISLYFLGEHAKLNMNLILNGTKSDTFDRP